MIINKTKYLCVAGESYDSIALMVFKDEKYASDIMAVNPQLCTIPQFNGGEIINLPVISEDKMDFIRNNAPWKE